MSCDHGRAKNMYRLPQLNSVVREGCCASGAEGHGSVRSLAPRLAFFGAAILFLGVIFRSSLTQYVRFAAKHDLHSYTFLVPPISAFLLWRRRDRISRSVDSCVLPRIFLGLLAVGIFVLWVEVHRRGLISNSNDTRSLDLVVLTTLVGITFALCFGLAAVGQVVFPLLLLFFVVPFPERAVQSMESALQYMSAEAFAILMSLTPIPVIRDGMTFALPGLTLAVAPECSGIRSTVVLFITTLVAGDLYLKSWWRRVVFSLAVVPIGAFRNAFRIMTIAVLTMYVNPATIKGPVHRQGGPLFFAFSLVLMLGMLAAFVRGERRAGLGSRQDLEPKSAGDAASANDKKRECGRMVGEQNGGL